MAKRARRYPRVVHCTSAFGRARHRAYLGQASHRLHQDCIFRRYPELDDMTEPFTNRQGYRDETFLNSRRARAAILAA